MQKIRANGFDIHYTRYINLHLRFRPYPPHIHVKCGGDEFTKTIKDRVVEGKAKAKTIQTINNFMDEHEAEVMEIWEKAQRGEKIEKIRR